MLTVEETIHHLGLSYGGLSQFGPFIVGQALAGQHNNATPWPFRKGLFAQRLHIAARLLCAYWDDTTPYQEVLTEIERGYVLQCMSLGRAELLDDWA